jgi:hypothetical protein
VPARHLLVGTLLVLVAAVGCDRQSRPSAAAADSALAGLPRGAPDADADSTACPDTGLWAQCSVEKRLEDAGFVPRPDQDAPERRAGFAAPVLGYTLGRARLEVFIYGDAAAAARDLAALDTVRVAPPGERGDWGGPPHLMRSANLIAVLVTLNERQAERVQLALTAGPPPRAD